MSVLACNRQEASTFPRRYRLSRREGYSRILQQKAHAKSWFAVYSQTNSSGHARLGVSVSKRVLPAATQRNTVKRLIRECFRRHNRHAAARDVIIRLRRPLDEKDLTEARITLSEMLETALTAK